MQHLNAVECLPMWNSRVATVPAEETGAEREPRNRRNHARFDAPALYEVTQSCLDKNTVARVHRIRIQRRECQYPCHDSGRAEPLHSGRGESQLLVIERDVLIHHTIQAEQPLCIGSTGETSPAGSIGLMCARENLMR